MAEKKAPKVPVVSQVKSILSQESVKQRFNEVLGSKANQFMASITNATSGNTTLQKCDANSIVGAAFVAASYDLPIDSNLGFSAIVPYNCKDPVTKEYGYKAQFQMMYKGFVQLAIRSGQYENMNVSEVYEDELESYNPITGELQLVTDFKLCNQRKEGQKDKIVGYYAWFKLLSGFRKELFMSTDDVTNHAMTYSASYKQDLSKGWTSSKWTTDFEAMAKKTVLKLLLSRWGILSIDMQRAISDDQKVYGANGEEDYIDNQPIIEDVPDVFEGEVIDSDTE